MRWVVRRAIDGIAVFVAWELVSRAAERAVNAYRQQRHVKAALAQASAVLKSAEAVSRQADKVASAVPDVREAGMEAIRALEDLKTVLAMREHPAGSALGADAANGERWPKDPEMRRLLGLEP
jgi:hypothetical protein